MENQNTEQNAQEEKVTLTKAEVEELKSYEKRYKDSQAEGELVAHIKKTTADNNYLLELAESNPKMAGRVADMWGLSLEDAIKKVKGEKKDDNLSKGDIKAQMKEIREQERAEETLEKFIADKNLSGDFLEDFQAEFDDYMEGKKWTKERVQKATRYALSEAKKVSKFAEEYAKVESKKSTLGGGGGSGQSKKKDSGLIAQWKNDKKKTTNLREKHNLVNRIK